MSPHSRTMIPGTRSWSGPDAPESPSPSVPALARDAVALLDTYEAARTIASRAAAEGQPAPVALREVRSAVAALCRAFYAIDDQVDGELLGVWWCRAQIVEAGGGIEDAWAVELEQLAAEHEGAGGGVGPAKLA